MYIYVCSICSIVALIYIYLIINDLCFYNNVTFIQKCYYNATNVVLFIINATKCYKCATFILQHNSLIINHAQNATNATRLFYVYNFMKEKIKKRPFLLWSL